MEPYRKSPNLKDRRKLQKHQLKKTKDRTKKGGKKAEETLCRKEEEEKLSILRLGNVGLKGDRQFGAKWGANERKCVENPPSGF